MQRHIVIAALFFVAMLPAIAVDASDLPNPLKNVKVGQWVEYRIMTPEGDITRKQTLNNIEGDGDDRILTFGISLSFDGEVVDEGEQQITYAAAVREQEDSIDGAQDLTMEKITTTLDFNGQEIDAVLVSFTQEDTRFSLYMSENIPIVGMIRMVVDDVPEPVMELIGFGE